MRHENLQRRNARTREARPWTVPGYEFRPVATSDPTFHDLKKAHPYFGYIEVRVDDVPPFLMFSNNDDRVAQIYFWFGPDAFECLSMRVWRRLLERSSTVFDVGAFTGVYTLVAACASPDIEVHAFEPVRRVYGRLVDNLVVNTLGTRVHAHNLALAGSDGVATMNLFRGHLTLASGSSLVTKTQVSPVGSEQVHTVRAAEFARQQGIERLDLAKVDVEGAEPFVVRGMEQLIDTRPDLLIEVSTRSALDEITATLGGDYSFAVLDDVNQRARIQDPDALGGFTNVLFTAMSRPDLGSLLEGVGAKVS